jgi:hypothetical protein
LGSKAIHYALVFLARFAAFLTGLFAAPFFDAGSAKRARQPVSQRDSEDEEVKWRLRLALIHSYA